MDSAATNESSRAPELDAAEQHNLAVPLLKLPAELRNTIFELVVTRPRPINTTSIFSDTSPSYIQDLVKQPALAQLCRSVRRDVLSIFYGANDFVIGVKYQSECWNVEEWLTAIGERNRAYMRTVLIREQTYGEFIDRVECECCNFQSDLLAEMKVTGWKTILGESHVAVDLTSFDFGDDAQASESESEDSADESDGGAVLPCDASIAEDWSLRFRRLKQLLRELKAPGNAAGRRVQGWPGTRVQGLAAVVATQEECRSMIFLLSQHGATWCSVILTSLDAPHSPACRP